MPLRLSTGLRDKLMGTADFGVIFTNCFLNIYAGNQPTSPDDPAAGTLLATIYRDGAALGLNFGPPTAGQVDIAAAETWTGAGLATGTAAWGRLYEATDNPALSSTTLGRLDGTIAVSGGNINMSSTAVVLGAIQTVTEFKVTMPAA